MNLVRSAAPLRALLAIVLSVGLAGTANATVQVGDLAPNFTKDQLGAPAPAARSLSDDAGKVVILFLLGYS